MADGGRRLDWAIGRARAALATALLVLGLAMPHEAAPAATLITLYNFQGVNQTRVDPLGDLILEKGVLYGSTSQGGTANLGSVFKLVSTGKGKNIRWRETMIFDFTAPMT